MGRILVNSWFHTFLLLLLLSGAVFVRLQDYEWSRALRYLAFDTFNIIHPRQPTDQVAIVDIDEISMGRDDLGQWPWPRQTVARLVTRLKDMGADAIVFDMVFAEYDRTSPGSFLKSMPENALPADLKTAVAGLKDHDLVLADAIRDAGNVVTGFIWSANKDATRRKPVLSKPISLGRDAVGIKKTVPRMIGVTTTIPELAQAAAGSGCFGVSTDIDGLIRQVPLLFSYDDLLYPSLALEALRVSQDPRLMVKIRALKNNEIRPLDPPLMMQVGKYEIPFDRDGKFFVYFSKARPEKYIPAWKVIDNAIDPSTVRGKIVIVGTSAEGLKDIRSTPLNLFIPGVEIHLNVIEQVLNGQFLKRPILLSGVELIFMTAIGMMTIILAPFIGAVVLALLTSALIAGMGYASWYLFLNHGLMLDPVYPSLGILALFVVASLLAYIRTEAERKHVRDAFSHYISPDFMKELTKNPDKLKLGGEVRELSVMFTDIRGFTAISERLSPEALIHLMNDFLTPMSALVMENRGTIDKYMGDAMMAFWNAPLDDADHARHACLTALAMNKALQPINDRLEKEAGNQPPLVLQAGIGIHTGPASVGNMGSKQRFAYSALGDTVNLASRLEGQTKAYGVSLLLSQATRDAVPGLAILELDLVRVRGKTEPVRIFTLIGDESVAGTPSFQGWKAIHDRMIEAYRKTDFETAAVFLDQARKESDGALEEFYKIFAARISALRADPPARGWDGVFDAQAK
jgi:adenylate cyclase